MLVTMSWLFFNCLHHKRKNVAEKKSKKNNLEEQEGTAIKGSISSLQNLYLEEFQKNYGIVKEKRKIRRPPKGILKKSEDMIDAIQVKKVVRFAESDSDSSTFRSFDDSSDTDDDNNFVTTAQIEPRQGNFGKQNLKKDTGVTSDVEKKENESTYWSGRRVRYATMGEGRFLRTVRIVDLVGEDE